MESFDCSLSLTLTPLLNACELIVRESRVSFSSVSFSSFNVCFDNEEASFSPSIFKTKDQA